MFRGIRRAVRNLRDWFPILVTDEHWDHAYLLEIIEKKLELMEKFHMSDKAWAQRHLETAQEIRYARLLLERILLDNYIYDTLPDWWDYVLKENKSEDEKEVFFKASIKADLLREQDIQKLFNHLSDNILEWWD